LSEEGKLPSIHISSDTDILENDNFDNSYTMVSTATLAADGRLALLAILNGTILV
jgi:hypothetical protein